MNDFEKKYQKKYPSKYTKKPTTRPEHIPSSVAVGGRNRPVVYRNDGYYYQDSAGKWILYSLLADRVMRDRYMYRNGYDPSGRYYTHSSTRSYSTRRRSSGSSSWIWFAVVIFIVIVIIAIAIQFYTRKQAKKEQEARQQRTKRRTKEQKLAARSLDKMTAQYWEQVRPNDTLTLKDEQTLLMLMEDKKIGYTMGTDVSVKVVRRVSEQRNLMKWHLYELEPVPIEGEESIWYLLVKVVDDAFDVRVMFESPSFETGDRDYLIREGLTFIFSPPDDPDYFDPSELEFAHEIDYSLDDGQQIIYKQKPQGILFGEMTEEPRPSGVRQPQFVSIMEYGATSDCPNPELMIVEVGDPSISSYVVLLQGINVNIHDVDILPT